MEEVLDVYQRPYDPQRPQLCMDEMPKQLLAETVAPLGMQPGQPEKQDYTYARQGTANLFLCFEPLVGKRFLETRTQRTAVDWAHTMQRLAVRVHDIANKFCSSITLNWVTTS